MGNKQARNTDPDPATGLSPRDRFLIKKSWDEMSHPDNVKGNGAELFVQLFQKFPSKKDYFPHFRGVDENTLRGKPIFKAHVLGVMTYLTMYVQHLHEPEILVALVEKLADSHIARGVTSQDFQDLASMFIPYLQSALKKNKLTPDMEEAWKKLLGAQGAIFDARVKATVTQL